jgi:uncharacterized membrane protein (DUF2068 family)
MRFLPYFPRHWLSLVFEVSSRHNPALLRWIGAFKLAKAVLLIALSFGAFALARRDVEVVIESLVEQIKIDPDNRYFQAVVGKLLMVSPKLHLLALGTFCYGAIFSVEGVGLILKKKWAEWLTIIVTGSFLPIEVFELVKHFTLTKSIILVLNLAIFIYLIIRRRGERKGAVLAEHSRV